jgi:hypothetical protein
MYNLLPQKQGTLIWIPLTYGFGLNLDVYKVENNYDLLYLDSSVNLITWLTILLFVIKF